jgi:hypothetical protein
MINFIIPPRPRFPASLGMTHGVILEETLWEMVPDLFGVGNKRVALQSKGETTMEEQKEIETFMDKVQRQRDEIFLQIHLAKAEMREEWESAEKKLERMKAKTPVVAKESGESLKDLGAAVRLVGEELLRSYERIKKSIER